ncbi:hypothetical protein [Streptomyces sp. NPDC002566]|uniref:hypothetical protein n=1 Tax=Streptomyces sp. NPDC002566 TaxID=3364650 RepID=UPI0036A9F6C4
MLWTEMRRGESKWIAALMTAIGAWYFLSPDAETSDWIGWWTQSAVEVQIFAVMVMGPLTSTGAAWTAGRVRRHRTLAWAETTARSGWEQTTMVWLSAMAWALPVYALFALMAFSRTAEVSAVTAPTWSPLVIGAAMVGLQTAIGVVVGVLSPSRIAVPFVGLGWYAALVGLALFAGEQRSSMPWALVPVLDVHWDVAFQPNAGRLLIGAVWCLAFGLLILAAPGLLRGRAARPALGTLLPVTLAAALAAGALFTFRAPLPELYWAVRTPQPTEPVCVTESGATACLWPADRHLLPEAEIALQRVQRSVGSVPGLTRMFYERGLATPSGSAPTAELPVYVPGMDREAMTQDMLAASLPQPPDGCSPHPLKDIGGYPDTFLFEAVVRDRARVQSTYWGDAFATGLERFLKAPKADQDQWLKAAAQDIRACRPVPAPPQRTAPTK